MKAGNVAGMKATSRFPNRPDIDGLRAIAVLSVFLYHLEVAPFGGGFVGVDIFFVISGYLISRIVLTDVERGSFSMALTIAGSGGWLQPALSPSSAPS